MPSLTSARRREPRPGKRNLRLAVATGITLGALVAGLLYLGPPAFFGLAFVVILIAQGEFYLATRKAGMAPAAALGLVAGGILMLGVFYRGEAAAGIVVFLAVVSSFVWFLALPPAARGITNITTTIFGIAYIPFLGSFAALLAARPHDGRGVTIVALAATVMYDVLAYAGGSRFGRTPLAPRISPNKTVQGAAIATGGLVALMVLIAPALGPWSRWESLVLGLVIAGMAPAGDLFESMLKRDLGIKDMGTIFPGHGGALDRIDAMLFVVPAVYFSLKVFGY
ncbi:MAG: phosphatidate cytidylyltransferase [Actinomycetota bacterium]